MYRSNSSSRDRIRPVSSSPVSKLVVPNARPDKQTRTSNVNIHILRHPRSRSCTRDLLMGGSEPSVRMALDPMVPNEYVSPFSSLEKGLQAVTFGAYLPIVIFVLRETRATVLLRRKAKKLRTERGMQDGGRYTAKSEVNKQAFGEAMKRSLSRPLSKSFSV